jgi:lipopolysaccharide biosynthesis glycosyltransferase
MINVVYNSSDKYVEYMLLSIYSIHKHTKSEIKFHILHSFNNESLNIVHNFLNSYNIKYDLILVDLNLLNDLKVPQTYYRIIKHEPICSLYEFQKKHNIITHKEANFNHPSLYYFILYGKLFGFSDFISLDCDTIFTTDILNLCSIPKEEGKIIMSRRDWSNEYFERDGIKYKHYNPGVCRYTSIDVYPLIEQLYFSTINNPTKAKFGMQHDLCIIMKDRIQELDYYWNYSVKKNEPLKNDILPYVLHYNTIISNFERIKDNVLYNELFKIANESNIKSYISKTK